MNIEQIRGLLSSIDGVLKAAIFLMIVLLILIISITGSILIGSLQEREVNMDILDKINNAEDGTLASTVEGMLSEDYKERFLAEYKQVYIRYSKLDTMLLKVKTNKIDFKLNSRVETLEKQRDLMLDYLMILEERAREENIKIHVF